MRFLFSLQFLLLVAWMPLRAAEIELSNASFESPVVSETGANIPGWKAGTGVELVREGCKPTVNITENGAQFVRFSGSGKENELSQTVAGHPLSKGLYVLSFDVADVFNDTVSPRPLTVSMSCVESRDTLASLEISAANIPGGDRIGGLAGRKRLECYIPEDSPNIGRNLTVTFKAGPAAGFAQTALDHITLECDPYAAVPALYTLDVSNLEPRTDDVLRGMGGKAKDGTEYSVTRNGWYRNGNPWFPVSGEFHYARYAPGEWDRELGKMRAMGVDVVATYVFWNQHEALENDWRWDGHLNLRRFVELAAKHSLLVWLRPGPYINAETVNGGIPAFANKGKRSNDPNYLAQVEDYFNALSKQLQGLWVKDGGPIVGMQIENEFASGQASHITALKNMAVAKGMFVPYYTVTANSRFEPGTVIPLQGAYTYRGWEAGGGNGAASGFVYGTDEWTANTDLGGTYYPTLDYPRGYCELGTGSPMGGNNRFFVEWKYVSAIAWDSVGRGSNYLGYYMFHGGTQHPGTSSGNWGTSYDFQAPLGEFGQLRESGRHYRRLHAFVREFTDELVPARAVRDPRQILDPAQTSRLRYIGRFTHEGRGFVFLNNTQRNVDMVPQDKVRFVVNTAAGRVVFPSKELTMPVDRTLVFPFRLDLNGVELSWATVQPLAKIENPGEPGAYVFWLPDWTNRELAFPKGTIIASEYGNVSTADSDDHVLVHADRDSRSSFTARAPGAAKVRILLLTEDDSLNAVIHRVDGRKRLIIASNGYVSRMFPALCIEGPAGGHVALEFFPGEGLVPGKRWSAAPACGGWARYDQGLAPAPTTPKVDSGGSGIWSVSADIAGWDGLAHAYLRFHYAGGSAQILYGGREITRDLYHSDSWLIDLKRFSKAMKEGLEVRVNGWDDAIQGVPKPGGQIPSLRSTEWQPRREVMWNDGSTGH